MFRSKLADQQEILIKLKIEKEREELQLIKTRKKNEEELHNKKIVILDSILNLLKVFIFVKWPFHITGGGGQQEVNLSIR